MDKTQPFTSVKGGDFDTSRILRQTSKHDKDIGALRKQLSGLEDKVSELRKLSESIYGRVGDNESFARTFSAAQKDSKEMDGAIERVIEEYDKHLLTVKGVALGKWVLVLIIGGVIGWFVSQVVSIPNYNSELDALRGKIENIEDDE